MFGSNDDKKAPPAGEKKGLFGWLRKKPQTPEQPAADTEPQVEQPVAAEPVAAPEQVPVAQTEALAPRAEPTPEPTPEPVIDVVPASVPVEPLAQPALQPEAQPAPQPELVVAEAPIAVEAPQPAIQQPAVQPPVSQPVEAPVAAQPVEPAPAPVAAPVQPEPVAEAPVVVEQPEAEPAPQPEPEAKPAATEPAKIGFFARLKQGLSKTSASLGEGMASLFLGKKAIDDDLLDEIETRLLTADVGVEATTTIVQNLTKRVARKELADSEALYKALQEELAGLLRPVEQPLTIPRDKQPYVILVVGVNGVGKTTTIGKLAKKLQLDGKKVMLAAGDTFRAAAVEQLQVWGERNNIAVIAQHTGADSASVIFDAVQAAKARGVDVLIADTAGRLHTKDNLMEELKKVRRVIGKLDETAPHEVLLVLDAGTGQNAINQAKQFNNAVELTGLALTKLDGTAKGGVIFALAKQFGLPIRYIGVGEGIDDLRTFEADAFVRALFETREIA
ncbi:signal recognition particle-docking protein FtsY [Pseudomonas sp. CAN2814]|uniref:signal recognition particle-docking protein FtsY n=1 Tax=Pseudomonas sp. CAN1 TaxID=3046726 RepID=UPI002647F28E|nr:signal recognition particle-docking protein FtsY [Pseudomonas sp. CAN1]MDN6856946.1 signal recognition particle-docking protein FtsY [Pseudomonas sp. CAN1]